MIKENIGLNIFQKSIIVNTSEKNVNYFCVLNT